MKRWILALLLALLMAGNVMAQEETPDANPAATVEATQAAPVATVDSPAVQFVYIDVMPEWVLPGYALCFAAMAFMLFVIWRQGGKLSEMVSEKAMQGLIKIGLDFARDLANKTKTPIDNAILDVVAGEVQPPVVNVTVTPPAQPAG